MRVLFAQVTFCKEPANFTIEVRMASQNSINSCLQSSLQSCDQWRSIPERSFLMVSPGYGHEINMGIVQLGSSIAHICAVLK